MIEAKHNIPTQDAYERKGKCGETQPKKIRDPIFSVIFYINVIVIITVAIAYGKKSFHDINMANNNNKFENDDVTFYYKVWIYMFVVTSIFSSGISTCMLTILMAIPNFLMKTALIFTIVLSGVSSLLGFYYGGVIFGIVGVICFAAMLCFARAAWPRIPFATANLVTSITAIRQNCGLIILSLFSVITAFGWTLIWSISISGIMAKMDRNQCDENNLDQNEKDCNGKVQTHYGYLFLFLVSYFFTHQVIKNTMHVTVSGVIGTWWFVPEEGKGCCSRGIRDSVKRSLTTSFGSICFGSILVAIVEALKQLAHQARANGSDYPFLICIAECILGCLESILEYFNTWAFVYVGLYGYGYLDAGKNVMKLFKECGWSAYLTDNLVGIVLGMICFLTGLLTAAFGVGFEAVVDWFEGYNEVEGRVISAIIGMISGVVLCSIVMSVIDSGVNSVIVLFAEAPFELEENYPELSKKMRSSWESSYPGCLSESHSEVNK